MSNNLVIFSINKITNPMQAGTVLAFDLNENTATMTGAGQKQVWKLDPTKVQALIAKRRDSTQWVEWTDGE